MIYEGKNSIGDNVNIHGFDDNGDLRISYANEDESLGGATVIPKEALDMLQKLQNTDIFKK